MAFDLSKITSVFTRNIKSGGTKNVVGVDIGASSIKIVQLGTRKNVPTLETYGELQLGPYAGIEIGRTTKLPVEKATEAFVDILRESSADATEAALAIPYLSSFVTVIDVPTVDESKLASMVPVEARKYIPVALNEVSLDWFPLDQSTGRSTKLLLAAIHNEGLKRQQNIVTRGGLQHTITEIELFSTIRAASAQSDSDVAIVDLGGGSTKLYLVSDGTVRRTHSLRLSGSELTEQYARAAGIEFEAAEEAKRTHGIAEVGNAPEASKALRRTIERGLQEIHRVIEQHTKEEDIAVKKIILTGGGALLRGLDTYAADQLQRTVVIADPFKKVAYPAFLEDTLKEAGPSFAVAVGVALRAMNPE